MTMKKIMLALVALLAGAGVARADVTVAPPPRFERFHVGVSVGLFYDTLSPYGDWVYVGSYGRVWRPNAGVVGVGFRPYATGGHWIYTDYGWSWDSDWDWGWAPFHYGRWLMDPVYGWVWAPDTTWGPAWVDWRFGGGYVGWAPLAPWGVSVSYDAYSPWWVFVDSPHFCDYGVYRYSLPYNRVVTTAWPVTQPYRATVGYGGARYYAGPPVAHIANAVGVPITPVHVSAPRPGVVAPVRAQVTANPSYARGVAQSPYHALASGRVSASPQAAAARPVMPQGGVRPMPSAPARSAAPAPMRPAAPGAMRPSAPAPSAPAPARPGTLPQVHARPMAPAPRPQPTYERPAAPAPMRPQPAPAPAPRAQPMMPRPAPQPAYRAPAAPAYRGPAPSYHAAPAPAPRAAPAPAQRQAPAPRNNAAAGRPERRHY
jgi:hypothetical protein